MLDATAGDTVLLPLAVILQRARGKRVLGVDRSIWHASADCTFCYVHIKSTVLPVRLCNTDLFTCNPGYSR